jgi:dienelactone hydrolase
MTYKLLGYPSGTPCLEQANRALPRRLLVGKIFLKTLPIFFVLFAFQARAEGPKVSNLQFSENPITLGDYFTISFEFEGGVDKYCLENTWETPAGEVKKEVKEFTVKPEIKEKPNGLISFRWKSENPHTKPYRIIKVWVKDVSGNQSNVLSGEVKVSKGMAEEEVKIPMEVKSIFGAKRVNLSGTIYRADSDRKFPLLVLNHGTPRDEQERKNVVKFRDQSKVFVKKGFAVVLPMRRGYGTSEGDYAESSGKCDSADYDIVAKEVVKDIKATVEFMRNKPYVDSDKKILMVGQSAGGFSSLAYASIYPDELVGVINFAGGKGSIKPYEVCSPERLVSTVGSFGRTSKKVPTLWVYTEKDDFFPPKLSKKMFEAYQNKGGQGKFLLLPSEFGHEFFHRTVAIKTWEPIVDEFLKEVSVR